MRLTDLHAPALGLLTDLYQLTMAQGYDHHGIADREASFSLYFRKAPFGGAYAVAAGLGPALDYLTDAFRFSGDDVAWLAAPRGADGRPLFRDAFLDRLRAARFTGHLDAVREGTVVFPNAPVLRVEAPLWQAQLVETALLNLVNFQTLIATKAARIVAAADGVPVLEFGLRRAQGIDGGLSATRAALIGGCAATSDALAARLLGAPARGTHAHAWVQVWEDEQTALDAYAEAMPGNCTLLVDTYDTLRGVERAAATAKRMEARGQRAAGIRLDSGDLFTLSRAAREILDREGLPYMKIVASNDLDEHAIAALREAGAPIDVFGVGTRLVTGYDQPALGGVYKLGALREADGSWSPRLKLSEEPAKVSDPGRLAVRRWTRADGQLAADRIYDLDQGPPATPASCEGCPSEELLVPAIRAGVRTAPPEPLAAIQARVQVGLAALPPAVRRLNRPAPYDVGRDPALDALRTRLQAAVSSSVSRGAAC